MAPHVLTALVDISVSALQDLKDDIATKVLNVSTSCL